MRKRHAGGAALGLGFIALSLALGQAPQPPQPPAAKSPAPRTLPNDLAQTGYTPPSAGATVAAGGRDLSKLSPLARQFHFCAQRGGEWLHRAHQPTGRFLDGWRAALNQPCDEGRYLHQADAALALARAARYHPNDGYAARARQSVLTLLAETGADARDPHARCTTLPNAVVNRLGAAGALLAAIHELPAPAEDLLTQGEQLARFIFNQQLRDGSLAAGDGPPDPEAVARYPGQALYGLMRSQQLRPHAWKAEFARRTLAHYRAWWRDHKSPAFAAAMAPALAEAFLASKERAKDAAFAEFCCELCDYLCGLQYEPLGVQQASWGGGFKPVEQGAPAAGAPKAADAAIIAALVEGCRVTRQLPDVERYPRYRDAARRGFQFLAALQYAESNTSHFEASYRRQYLLGGFRTSPHDGDLRLDDTARCVAALVQYLVCVPDA